MPGFANYEFEYLPALELQTIERDRAINLQDADMLGRVMPIAFLNGDSVVWDQKDDVAGLLPAKRVGAPYPQMNATGGRRKAVPSTHYGGVKTVDAKKIVAAAEFGTVGQKLNVDGFTSELQEEMAIHEYQLMQYQRGKVLATGTVDILDEDENVLEILIVEGFAETRLLTLAGGEKWDTFSTSDPIKVLSQVHDLYFKGTGYAGNQRAVAMMSPKTREYMLESASVRAIRNQFGATITDLQGFNAKFNAGHIPLIEEIEGTALLKSGATPQYIPDGYVVVVGYHISRGNVCGNWTVTSNENAMGKPIIFAETDLEPNHPKLPRTMRSIAGAVGPFTSKQVVSIKVF